MIQIDVCHHSPFEIDKAPCPLCLEKKLRARLEAAERVIEEGKQLLALMSTSVTPRRTDERCLYCGVNVHTERHEDWCNYAKQESEYEKLYDEYKKGQTQ